MKVPFKARKIENGLGVIDVIGEDGEYHADPLCHPIPYSKTHRRAEILNAENARRLRNA